MTDLQAQANELDADLTEIVLNPHINIGFARRDAIRRASAILRRIERGELVEVVRCGECKSHRNCGIEMAGKRMGMPGCLRGRRKSDANG